MPRIPALSFLVNRKLAATKHPNQLLASKPMYTNWLHRKALLFGSEFQDILQIGFYESASREGYSSAAKGIIRDWHETELKVASSLDKDRLIVMHALQKVMS